MRAVGTKAMGIRLPIISKGDDLIAIILDSIDRAIANDGVILREHDIFGITESVVAKAQGNFATLNQIITDVRAKFPAGTVGLVYPMPSRNRFLNILKAVSLACEKVYVLLQYPSDEVGNPIMPMHQYLQLRQEGFTGLHSADAFQKLTNYYKHPYTNMDYISVYQEVNENISIFLSDNPCDILQLTDHVLNCKFHDIEDTNDILKKKGVATLYSLHDILKESVDGSGYNGTYGLLGSNISTMDSVKLFPRDCEDFVDALQTAIAEKYHITPEVLVYGDGAYKDPETGIWELADPVVSPAYTKGLSGLPQELKLKYIADEFYSEADSQQKEERIREAIAHKADFSSEGTTPRKFYNLIGSLCDLVSGSGDKGTPLVLIQGYFDDYSTK